MGEASLNISMVEQTAVLMNLGGTDPRIAHIYELNCNWKDYLEAIELNKKHGEYSVEIAESAGVVLTNEPKSVISGHSKGEYPGVLGQTIKISEICKATESSRW